MSTCIELSPCGTVMMPTYKFVVAECLSNVTMVYNEYHYVICAVNRKQFGVYVYQIGYSYWLLSSNRRIKFACVAMCSLVMSILDIGKHKNFISVQFYKKLGKHYEYLQKQ